MPINLTIHTIMTDNRTQTPVILAQISIIDYLNWIGDDFDDFIIQRKRQEHKAYGRMKTDIIAGTLLPTVTLAVNLDDAVKMAVFAKKNDRVKLLRELVVPGRVHILDGLQRTFILKDLAKYGHEFASDHYLNLEIWIEPEIKHLIYRIIILNAGQKPMTMKHQIELLFGALKDRLETDLDIDLFTERDESKRTHAKMYMLDRIATSYQCFLMQTSEVDKGNIVAQNLAEEDIFDSSEEKLSGIYSAFKKAFKLFVKLDEVVCAAYDKSRSSIVTNVVSWMGNENTLRSYFTAASRFLLDKDMKKQQRVEDAVNSLVSSIKSGKKLNDLLGLDELSEIKAGFDNRKVNVGYASRKLLTNGFKEFFREGGDIELRACWITESE